MSRLKGQLKAPKEPLSPSFNPFGSYVFHGAPEIARYMRCTPPTIYQWVKKHAFPACKMPGGSLCTTTGLIDRWILARAARPPENLPQ